MLRNLGKTLLGVGGLVSSYAFATPHVLVSGMTLSYELPVDTPQVFANFLMWPISAVCAINDAEDNSDILISGISRNSIINGTPLNQSQKLTVTVNTGDELSIYAVAGARVELTNKGTRVVKARCSTT